MTLTLQAPHPRYLVTTQLPDPTFDNVRSPETEVHIKRSMLGRRIIYVTSSEQETLKLRFRLTRQKSLELEAFVTAYRAATWKLEFDHDNSTWTAKLIGSPVVRTATDRLGDNVEFGSDEVEVTLTLSGTKVS